jgi:hypothetical protein
MIACECTNCCNFCSPLFAYISQLHEKLSTFSKKIYEKIPIIIGNNVPSSFYIEVLYVDEYISPK